MRDKIVIREKGAYKTAKRPPAQKKKKKKERDNIRLKRSAEFRQTNNSPVAISLEPNVDPAMFFIYFSLTILY